jgi:hypothetical protein
LLIRSPNAMPLGSRCLCVVQHNLAPGRIPSNNQYHHLDCIATKCFRSFCHTEISRAVTHYIKKRIPNIAIAQTPHIQRRNTAQNNTQILFDLVVTPADRSILTLPLVTLLLPRIMIQRIRIFPPPS